MLRTLELVRATHDILRNRHTVVKCGARGRILDSHHDSPTTYVVQFNSVRGATVTLAGLTERDVQRD